MRKKDITNENEVKNNEQNLCEICREREKSYAESKYSIACNECRKKHKKLNIPLKVKLFLGAIFILFIFSIIKLPPVLSDYKTYLEAEKNISAREYSIAYHKYYALLEKYDGSINLAFKASDAAMSAQYFDAVAQIFDDHIAEKELDDEQYAKATEYSNLLDLYYVTLEEITKIEERLSYDHTEEDIKSIVKELEKLLDNSNMDKTLIYLHLGLLTSDNDDALKFMKQAVENDSRFTYPYAYYGNSLRWMGKIDEAKTIYGLALGINTTDAFALRGYSIIRLLEGDKVSSLELMKSAFELEPNGLYMADALIIALCENNLRDEAMSLFRSLTNDGFQVSTDLQQYLDGKININQYYINEE